MTGLLLAAVALLVVAGAVKAVRPHDTARALHVPAVAVRAGAAVEVACGVLALATPWGHYAVAASYAGFAVFVAGALRRGAPLSSCGCFGEPDTPPTIEHVVVDVVLAIGALLASRGGLWSPPTLLLAVVVAGLAYLVMTDLAKVRVA